MKNKCSLQNLTLSVLIRYSYDYVVCYHRKTTTLYPNALAIMLFNFSATLSGDSLLGASENQGLSHQTLQGEHVVVVFLC